MFYYYNTERNTTTLAKILEKNIHNFSQKYCEGKWKLTFFFLRKMDSRKKRYLVFEGKLLRRSFSSYSN